MQVCLPSSRLLGPIFTLSMYQRVLRRTSLVQDRMPCSFFFKGNQPYLYMTKNYSKDSYLKAEELQECKSMGLPNKENNDRAIAKDHNCCNNFEFSLTQHCTAVKIVTSNVYRVLYCKPHTWLSTSHVLLAHLTLS